MVIDGRQLSLVYNIESEAPTYALRDINISIGTNEIIGITGPSGSGKSSLLYLLSGLKTPSSGTVYYDDVDISTYSSSEKANLRRTRFGFIFQRHFLIDYLSVLDNVLSVTNSNTGDEIEKAMELLAQLKISHLSGKKPYQLSNGQRQKAAIARALINNPEVIFADEPTASLDHNNAREVMDVLESCHTRSSIIVATHDRVMLQNAGRIIELWDGQLVSY